MSANLKKWIAARYAACVAVMTGILLGVMYMVSGLGGDDWSYMSVFGRYDGVAKYDYGIGGLILIYAPHHWFSVNGRGANYLAAYIGGFLPAWGLHIVAAVAVLGMSVLAVRLAGAWNSFGRQMAGTLIAFGVMFLLPWGDELFTFDVAMNYVATSALVLAFMWLVLCHSNVPSYATVVLGLLAGAMHEAAGVPVAFAAIIFFLFHRSQWRALQRGARSGWIAFAIGALTTIISPGIWGRAAHNLGAERHWQLWETAFYSAPLAVLLILAVALIWLTDLFTGEKRLHKVFGRTTFIFTVAACGALLFCMAGDFVGRNGWFAQLFAMIALCRISACTLRVPHTFAGMVSGIVGGIIVLHGVLTIPVLANDGRLLRQIDFQAGKSRSTLIFVDFNDETAQPWYTVGKLRSLRGTHNYYTEGIARYYSLPETTLLPSEFRRIDLDSISGSITDSSGRYTISSTPLCPTAPSHYFRSTVWNQTHATDTAVIQFCTPSGRPLWLAIPNRYHFYLWPPVYKNKKSNQSSL